MGTCERKEIRIALWAVIGAFIVAVLLIVASYLLGHHIYGSAKKQMDAATAKEAVAAEKQSYEIIELDPGREYMIKSLKYYRNTEDCTRELAAGSRELSKKFYTENKEAINEYYGRTIAFIVSVRLK